MTKRIKNLISDIAHLIFLIAYIVAMFIKYYDQSKGVMPTTWDLFSIITFSTILIISNASYNKRNP